MEYLIVKMYINGIKDYYLVSLEDYENFIKGRGYLPYLLKNKFKKNIEFIIKNNDFYKKLNIKIIKRKV